MKIENENIYVQVKYSDLACDPKNIERYFFGFGGELYFSSGEIYDHDHKIAGEIKSFVKSKNLALRLHAPIIEIDYSELRDIKPYIHSTYDRVIDICRALSIKSIVAHAEFNYRINFSVKRQLDAAVLLWRELCDKCETKLIDLNMENHNELFADDLVALAKKIDSKHFGLCFDVGHINAFSNSSPDEWIESCPGHLLKEAHLADNMGDDDTHLPLGEGTIDIKNFVKSCIELNRDSVFVLEPRNVEETERSLLFLRREGIID
ncbi:MAG: sugar phosphate isomerase/epimerase family protein [Candidatus Omnitrophota bacterium]